MLTEQEELYYKKQYEIAMKIKEREVLVASMNAELTTEQNSYNDKKHAIKYKWQLQINAKQDEIDAIEV